MLLKAAIVLEAVLVIGSLVALYGSLMSWQDTIPEKLLSAGVSRRARRDAAGIAAILNTSVLTATRSAAWMQRANVSSRLDDVTMFKNSSCQSLNSSTLDVLRFIDDVLEQRASRIVALYEAVPRGGSISDTLGTYPDWTVAGCKGRHTCFTMWINSSSNSGDASITTWLQANGTAAVPWANNASSSGGTELLLQRLSGVQLLALLRGTQTFRIAAVNDTETCSISRSRQGGSTSCVTVVAIACTSVLRTMNGNLCESVLIAEVNATYMHPPPPASSSSLLNDEVAVRLIAQLSSRVSTTLDEMFVEVPGYSDVRSSESFPSIDSTGACPGNTNFVCHAEMVSVGHSEVSLRVVAAGEKHSFVQSKSSVWVLEIGVIFGASILLLVSSYVLHGAVILTSLSVLSRMVQRIPLASSSRENGPPLLSPTSAHDVDSSLGSAYHQDTTKLRTLIFGDDEDLVGRSGALRDITSLELQFLYLGKRLFSEVCNALLTIVELQQDMHIASKFVPLSTTNNRIDLLSGGRGAADQHDDDDDVPPDDDERGTRSLIIGSASHQGEADRTRGSGSASASISRVNSECDDSELMTLFGIAPSSIENAAANSQNEDSLSFGSSDSGGILGTSLSRGLFSPATTGSHSKGRANNFRQITCTCLYIQCPIPPHSDIEHVSGMTRDFMNATIASITELGGLIDRQSPCAIVAYFAASRSQFGLGSPWDDDAHHHETQHSSIRAMCSLQRFASVDQQKTPVRAIACCYRTLLRFESPQLRKNTSFLIHKGTFLCGNVGSKDRLSRVVFSPDGEGAAQSLVQLNQSVLGAQIICTLRAARVIEGAYRRSHMLLQLAVVVPVDCVAAQEHELNDVADAAIYSTGHHSNATSMGSEPAGDLGTARSKEREEAFSMSRQLWLFAVILLTQDRDEVILSLQGPGNVPEPFIKRSLLGFPLADRFKLIKQLFAVFHAAIDVGFSMQAPERLAQVREASLGTGKTSKTEMMSFQDAQSLLAKLADVTELAPLVQHLQYSLDVVSGSRHRPLLSTVENGNSRREERDRLTYCRQKLPGWNLFWRPSLADVHKKRMREHAARLREYQARSATEVSRSVGRQRDRRVERKPLAIPPPSWSQELQPIPTPTNLSNNAIPAMLLPPTCAHAQRDATNGDRDIAGGGMGRPETHRQIASLDQEGGFALFDVFVPHHGLPFQNMNPIGLEGLPLPLPPTEDGTVGAPDVKAIVDPHITPETNNGVASTAPSAHVAPRLKAMPSTGSGDEDQSPPLLPIQSSSPAPDVDAILGTLPAIIRDTKDTWWIRSNDSLGYGSFSTVYSGLAMDGSVVALKCISYTAQHMCIPDIEREVNVACTFSHDNIVKYHGWVLLPAHVVIVMECVPGGSLQCMMQRMKHLPGGIPSSLWLRYARDCLRGLAFLHRHGVVHCDVKPQNVLLSQNGGAKLTDFGSMSSEAYLPAERPRSDDPGVVMRLRGTVVYMAPELLAGATPTPACDVFSFGVLLHELATNGALPWGVAGPLDNSGAALPSLVEQQQLLCDTIPSSMASSAELSELHRSATESRKSAQLATILKNQHTFLQFVSNGCVGIRLDHPIVTNNAELLSILSKCLAADATQRPSCADLLRSSFFA